MQKSSEPISKILYVVGFLFDYPVNNVVLIKKTHPPWQEGLCNGIGGKAEPGETPLECIRREFMEETGCWVDKWEKFLILTDQKYNGEVHFFRAFATTEEQALVQTVTDKTVLICPLKHLPNTVPNLKYIIPMALDPEIRTSSIYLL